MHDSVVRKVLCAAALVFAATTTLATSEVQMSPEFPVGWATSWLVSPGVEVRVLDEDSRRVAWDVDLTLFSDLRLGPDHGMQTFSVSLIGDGRSPGSDAEVMLAVFERAAPPIRATLSSEEPVQAVTLSLGAQPLDVPGSKTFEPLGSTAVFIEPSCDTDPENSSGISQESSFCSRSLRIVLESVGGAPVEIAPLIEIHASGNGSPSFFEATVSEVLDDEVGQ